ncbi:tetratricopeptide repeat protein [Zhouia sp. PK063]|uniref:tetratricopeptide repeat protein n=1 Tax=Zhouia sp. PK063 TaxID=3373602 RepID=UPI0037B25BE0
MRFIVPFLFIISLVSCKHTPTHKEKAPAKVVADNTELYTMYKADQDDRRMDVDKVGALRITKRDSMRRERVEELLDAHLVRTAKDYENAAMIFQHGKDSVDYEMAIKLMQKAIAIDGTTDKWLLAAATDSYLLSKGDPQIYGTQYHKKNGEPWERSPIDTTKITDEERIPYGVKTLAQQREQLLQLNKKKLRELLAAGHTVAEVVQQIQENTDLATTYDISEGGINNFGYTIMEDSSSTAALPIFKLNTTLYPNAYNTFDSYGACLLKEGDTAKAIAAYQKSLALHSSNTNAVRVLKQLQ